MEVAHRFLATLTTDDAWTPALVARLSALPVAETRPLLERLWTRGGLEDAVVPVLATKPDPGDRVKFHVGLKSVQPKVVQAAAKALAALPRSTEPADAVALVAALRRLPADATGADARTAVTAALQHTSGQPIGPDPAAWVNWLARTHPAVKLPAADGFDPAAWAAREANIDWNGGDAGRGKAVFIKATCAACHDGGGALGPALAGVGKRFGRADLLTSILEPSKDVPARYRPTRFTTTDDQVFVGLVVYEATDGVMLLTAPDTAVRIAGDKVAGKKAARHVDDVRRAARQAVRPRRSRTCWRTYGACSR